MSVAVHPISLPPARYLSAYSCCPAVRPQLPRPPPMHALLCCHLCICVCLHTFMCYHAWCLSCVALQILSTNQQIAFELQGSSFKLVVGSLQVTGRWWESGCGRSGQVIGCMCSCFTLLCMANAAAAEHFTHAKASWVYTHCSSGGSGSNYANLGRASRQHHPHRKAWVVGSHACSHPAKCSGPPSPHVLMTSWPPAAVASAYTAWLRCLAGLQVDVNGENKEVPRAFLAGNTAFIFTNPSEHCSLAGERWAAVWSLYC